MKGTVKFYNIKRGFGFITDTDGKDHYFNRSSLRRDRVYDPVEGDEVEFLQRDAPLGPIAHHIEQILPDSQRKSA